MVKIKAVQKPLKGTSCKMTKMTIQAPLVK